MDSGAVANVINRNDLPKGVVPDGIVKTHFVGASGEHIENYGTCRTLLKGNMQDVVTEWQAADVSKALHSISATTGPEDGPGIHDVLFNNKMGVVVPPRSGQQDPRADHAHLQVRSLGRAVHC